MIEIVRWKAEMERFRVVGVRQDGRDWGRAWRGNLDAPDSTSWGC